jgi:Lanthionine synthetase C-like protein
VEAFRGSEKIHELILGACNYIMNVRLENAPLVFPTVVGKIEKDIYPKNYCYGDFGTLYGLMRGYQFLDDGPNVEKCVLLFDEIDMKGYDAPYLSAGQSLLYGNAGLAMLFRKFNQHHPSSTFVEAYEKRIDKILATYDNNAEWMGFTGYWNQELDYINYTFNEGIIGIVIELMHLAKPEMDCKFEEFFYLKN